MAEAYIHDQENIESPEERRVNAARQVPKRQGSKYADILLQRLQTTVLEENESAVVGLTSYAPRQGVSTMAANLAIRAADHFYGPTLILDTNHRNQKISRLFRCTGPGFGECLVGDASLEDCATKTKYSDLRVVGIGQNRLAKQIVIDPGAVESFVKVIRNDFRFSVVDLPTLSEPSISDSLIPWLDGVIIVARYGIRKEHLAQMQDRIRERGGTLLGVVMNGDETTIPGWLPRWLS